MTHTTETTRTAATPASSWEISATNPQRARILDPDFEYVCAAATDVTRTWRKHGWTPLGEKQ